MPHSSRVTNQQQLSILEFLLLAVNTKVVEMTEVPHKDCLYFTSFSLNLAKFKKFSTIIV